MSTVGMGPRARAASHEAQVRVRNFRLTILAVAAGLTVGGIALAIVVLPAFIVIYGGMLPTMVAFLIDDRSGRYLFRTVAVTNAAGVIPYLLDSFRYSSNAGVIISPAGRIDTWMTMYGAAIGGWLLVIGIPLVWRMGFEMVLEFRMGRYEEARKLFAQEWDLDN